MHYKNGREAKVGEQVVGKDSNGNAVGGTLVEINPGSTACNGKVLPVNMLWQCPTVTLSDCLHLDDAFAPVDKTELNKG